MTLIWAQAVIAEIGFDGWTYAGLPKWVSRVLYYGYSLIKTEWRFVPFALGAASRMTKKH